jgi:alpha-tubulin suppressor-like RCC1 family protein
VLAAFLAFCLLGLLFGASARAGGGTVEGWGENYYGQAGGTPLTSGCECAETPVAVNGLSGVTQVSGGSYHGLALLSNGTVMAWGYNGNGQLGDGTTNDSSTPVPVAGLSNVVAVAGGDEHSIALLSNGTVMAWGDNSYGELGVGTTTGPDNCGGGNCSKTPVPVPGLSNVIAIDAGYYYSTALLSNGTVMAWGDDEYGELGDGVGVEEGCYCVDHPVAVPGVSGAMAISADWYVASALLQDGTIRNWGYNYDGELGIGTQSSTGCDCLGPVSPSGLSGARATASGGYHGLALLASGGVQGWGYNLEGQVGTGSFTTTGCKCVPAPTVVGGLSNPTALAAGAYHSLALLSNGTVMGWGENADGQVGDGTLENRASPVSVSGLSGVSGIAANDFQSYAIVGPAQTLTVSLAGAGSGKVGGQNILCPTSCTARYPQGQVEILRPEPSPGSGFAGFSGPCTGTVSCQVNMSQDQTVTATFGPPKGTTITKATIVSRKKKARFAFSVLGAITGFECELIAPKPKLHRKHHKGGAKRSSKAGAGKKPKFATCASAKLYKNLAPGRYTFQVRALDILGADAVPAKKTFRIKPVKHRKRHKQKH